ncbi:hypothetical protein C8J56DRAFT_929900 [Mycena floridula]|nr:hypothetical protein C8J56DRAFT_929900 [Mycena floridula]
MLRWIQCTVRGNSEPHLFLFRRYYARLIQRPAMKRRETFTVESFFSHLLESNILGDAPEELNPLQPSREALQPKVLPNLGPAPSATTIQPISNIQSSETNIEPRQHVKKPQKLPPSPALSLLRSFLAPESTETRTVADVMQLYDTILERNLATMMSSGDMTALISLFGTLAEPTPRCVFSSDVASRIEPSPEDTWPLVVKLATDKREFRKRLSDSDRYWLQRYRLTEKETPNFTALAYAKRRYDAIWWRTSDPDVHLPYFEAMLSSTWPEFFITAVKGFCSVLQRFRDPHGRFVDLLWRLILCYPDRITPAAIAHLTNLPWVRLTKFTKAQTTRPIFRTLPRYAWEPVEQKHMRIPLELPGITAALSAPLLPSFFRASVPSEVQRWCIQQGRLAFSPGLSRGTRWKNMILLALSHKPEVLQQTLAPLVATEAEPSEAGDWQSIMMLRVLSEALEKTELPPSQLAASQHITRSLWRDWKSGSEEERPGIVSQGVLKAYFRLSVTTNDYPLFKDCQAYCLQHRLLVEPATVTAWRRSQTKALALEYAVSLVHHSGKQWVSFIETIAASSSDQTVQGQAIAAVVGHFLSTDLNAARDVYRLCNDRNIPLPTSVIHALSIAVATFHGPSAIPFLFQPDFSRSERQQLLTIVLEFFRKERTVIIPPDSAQIIAQCLLQLYKESPPESWSLKYPIRFAIPILVASGQAAPAILVLQAIHAKKRRFFTVRYLFRVAKELLRVRQFRLAVQLAPLSPEGAKPMSLLHFRQKLLLRLVKANVNVLAKDVYRTIRKRGWLHLRKSPLRRKRQLEFIARRVWFQTLPLNLRKLTSSPRVLDRPVTGVRNLYSLLIYTKRPALARYLFRDTCKYLDSKTKTYMGNLYLQKTFLGTRASRGQGTLVREILRARTFLVNRYKFVDDRVTLNIILKAILKWGTGYSSEILQVLFDNLIRRGYGPSGPEAPFRTSPRASLPAPVPDMLTKLQGPIHFLKHVKPLFRMFIRAFYLRGDGDSARLVLRLLKGQEAVDLRRRQAEDKARRLGNERKRQAVHGKVRNR